MANSNRNKAGREDTEADRRRAAGRAGQESGHAQASASIEQALKDVHFPASRDQLVHDVGHRRIPVSGNRTVTLGQILKRVPIAEFHNAQEVRDGVNWSWVAVEGLGEGRT